MEKIRSLIFYKNYFNDFFNEQNEKVKDKIDYVLFLITITERVPKKFMEHLTGTDGLYEIRIEFQSNIYRVFCCFDEGKIVVVFNGFQKKSQKTPLSVIEKALKIKEDYFRDKVNNQKDEKRK
ncbi:MAG: type II toxin-antitoxin system RelE/ParE family toxin [Pelobium sp.]